MSSDAGLGSAFAGLDGLCKAEVWPLDVGKVQERPSRMEAIYYGSDGYQAVEALHASKLELTSLGKLARVIWFGPFARRYVDDPAYGLPFLTSSTMMEARPKATKLVSIKHTRNLRELQVRKDYILVSCSGTVGNVALCTDDVDGWACSQDAIRVVVRDPIDLGPIYCYLQSALGQFLLQRSQTGSVVRHLYEADVANLPIPQLPLELRRDLTERIRQVSALRVEANRLLDEAERMVQEQLDLPPVEKLQDQLATEPVAPTGLVSFAVSSSQFDLARSFFGKLRLDAPYHLPVTVRLRERLSQLPGTKELKQLVCTITRSSLRNRTFVEGEEHGVPMIGGKELLRSRLPAPRCLSLARTKKAAQEKIAPGSVLVTSGGTLGRIMFVHRNFEGYAASEHVIKVFPDASRADPGYLFAFLTSEYGQAQIDQQAYGSVIPMLRDFQLGSVLVALPSDRGESIGDLVRKAFSARADATDLEGNAITDFSAAIGKTPLADSDKAQK